jgi:transcriptional regulator with XRE-family HTH domain
MLSNKKTTDSINMGQMIKKVLKERGISISDFAKAIHCSRTNVYGIFKRQSIDIERLKQIANVLELDVADFIVLKRRESNKRVVIVEINEEDLEQLLNEYDLTYIKHWKVK